MIYNATLLNSMLTNSASVMYTKCSKKTIPYTNCNTLTTVAKMCTSKKPSDILLSYFSSKTETNSHALVKIMLIHYQMVVSFKVTGFAARPVTVRASL